jgi:hypothetical protein
MNITKITVLLMTGSIPRITLHTDLPSPLTESGNEELSLSFESSSSHWEEYIDKHFPDIEIKVLDYRSGPTIQSPVFKL